MYNTGYPWITKGAVEFLQQYITGKTVLEYGMGGSTLWFAKHAKSVISIDHNEDWFDKTREQTKDYSNVTLMLHKKPYDGAILKAKFDFILIDGRDRVKCFRQAIKMATEVIMLDNSERPEYEECFDLAENMKMYEALGPDYTGTFNYPDWKTTWWKV